MRTTVLALVVVVLTGFSLWETDPTSAHEASIHDDALRLSEATAQPPASGATAADDESDKAGAKKPKGIYHDIMEEIETLFEEIKEIRKDSSQYEAAIPKAQQLQAHFEKLIPLTSARVQELGTAKEVARQLEAKAMMVESLAHCIGLQAALMQNDADAVNGRLRKLNSVKNSAHREFQP